ncbi:COP9 signalosome complex subunit 3-like [Pollicipes pollicipes]|uniref:COP9 signalosome complex subunit 3-like n=1 Tax=Pollicipes pollicipes TaxID=41117 RepID=UPI00188592CB|nr:COP9 signalosome complex subunit 3-like [Pollicipes pollicipes]XP_037091414.1 COP9 signalosome complex subunit 3-like [Pollicipes pollicipes]XP_037091421.1 COP9 signalosome complex subunit 3-like [Pollicipes pollicipes]
MSFPLESYVNSVKTLSSQGNLSCLYEFLENSAELLSKNVSHIDTALAALEIEHHSLGILAIMLARFSAGGGDASVLDKQMEEFVDGCVVDQIRYAPDSYAELCHLYTQKLLERNKPLKGLHVLRKAIAKIQANPNQLTSIHADLCQLALSAKCFRPALDVLDVDIADISKENGKFDAKHLLLYYYYGGMIYAAMKQFERAMYFFEAYFTVPALAVSHIMVEAYKKHILMSLILRVESPQSQKLRYHETVRQTISRRLRPLCPAYVELATAFASPSPDQLLAVVARHQEQFARDQNTGLVKQCVASYHKMNIQRLTKTFLTLSLSDVSSRVQLNGTQRAEMYILSMIEDGEIFAAIDQRDGMVRFHDNPEQYNAPEMVARLERELAQIMSLGRRLQELDEEIQLEPQYVQKCHKTQEEDTGQACSSSQNNKAVNNIM